MAAGLYYYGTFNAVLMFYEYKKAALSGGVSKN